MGKLSKQISALIGAAAVFAAFDLAVYNVFTRRCISDYSEGMQSKSIELDKYLPFDEDSLIVKERAAEPISGELPVIDGAAALYPVFSAFVNAAYPPESVSFDGEGFAQGSALQYRNTRGAYKAVVDGEVDIAVCAKPSAQQLAYAEENGAELCFVPIGKEAFVFIVNAHNPVESLTAEQVRGIYSGKYTNWKQLGGENKPISALQRNEGSGSQTAFESFMGGEEIVDDWNTFIGSSIGFSFRYYVEGLVADSGVKMLALDGVYPSRGNVSSGEYPIVSEFYAVYRSDNNNPNLEKMIDFMLSEQGQRIVEGSGYCRVN